MTGGHHDDNHAPDAFDEQRPRSGHRSSDPPRIVTSAVPTSPLRPDLSALRKEGAREFGNNAGGVAPQLVPAPHSDDLVRLLLSHCFTVRQARGLPTVRTSEAMNPPRCSTDITTGSRGSLAPPLQAGHRDTEPAPRVDGISGDRLRRRADRRKPHLIGRRSDDATVPATPHDRGIRQGRRG